MSRPNKVYLLMHASGQSFKIGIAVQTHRRAAALPDDIDMARSLEAVVTTGRAESVEKILHYLCRDLSTTAERIERGDVGDGYTEWFAAEAFDQARAFIDGHAEMLGVTRLRPVELPMRHAPQTATLKTVLKHVAREDRVEAAIRQNTRALETTGRLLEDLQATGLLLGSRLDANGEWAVLIAGLGVQSWDDRFAPNSESLQLRHLPRGVGGVVSSWLSIEDRFAEIRISGSLGPGRNTNDETPCADEFRRIFSGLLPDSGSSKERELELAWAALNKVTRVGFSAAWLDEFFGAGDMLKVGR